MSALRRNPPNRHDAYKVQIGPTFRSLGVELTLGAPKMVGYYNGCRFGPDILSKHEQRNSFHKVDIENSTHMRLYFAAMIVLLMIMGCSRKTENPHSLILFGAQTDALKAKIVLEELRAGRLTNALEALEQEIDSSVIKIDHSQPKVTTTEKDSALGVLQALKAYREAHPRQREVIIPNADTKEMTEKASRILAGIK